MTSITDIKSCFGCGFCSIICSHSAIELQLNDEGFYQPMMKNPSRCVDCGLCVKVCAFINQQEYPRPIKSFAGWSANQEVRRSSTSGGVSIELAKLLIEKGYYFCGVRYNTQKERAEHYIANNINDLEISKGSKYIQSFTEDCFRHIDRKKKYIVVGSPCQVASLRRYTDIFDCTNNFVLVDFFCHGIPSYLIWKKYLEEHSVGIGEVRSVSWRNKNNGWHKSYCISLDGTNGSYSSKNNDDFFTLFLSDSCLNNACYKSCRFRLDQSSADIRIGDFWGDTYKTNEDGVNSIVAFTEKGYKILESANIVLKPLSFESVASGQMRHNPHKPWYYKLLLKLLSKSHVKLHSLAILVRLTIYIKKVLCYKNS